MGQAYTPGLKVTAKTVHRSRRILPIAGDVLKKTGDVVVAKDVVAQTFMPGEILPVNIANLLSMPPADVPECMLKKVGERIAVGEPMARSKGMFGMFKSVFASKVEGTIESVSGVTGQVIIRGAPLPVQVHAYLAGRVVDVLPHEGVVVEATVSLVQGIFGIGGEAHGPIRMACTKHDERLDESHVKADMKGCVIVGGGRITAGAIRKAVTSGASAIVSGGIDDQDLKEFLGYDLGVAITGSEKLGLTIIITEGFGDIAMAQRTFGLLKSREGDEASVNGATQIRAGVMRPEILIPVRTTSSSDSDKTPEAGLLSVGRPVRIIRDPYFGQIGAVSALPHEPQVLGSGSKARVLEVKFDSGERVVIPRANVELIEG